MVKADCFRYRLETNKADPQFMAYAMSVTACSLAGSMAVGVTRPRMNLSLTSGRVIAFPPLEEQAEIADFLDAKTIDVQHMIERIEIAISNLTEYRTALITDAVTGKIDVRGVQIPVQP